MLPPVSPLTELRNALADGSLTPAAIAAATIAKANTNASRNTYHHFDPEALLAQAETLSPDAPLFSVPISLKDLFDLRGTPTSAGTRFYAALNPSAPADSSVATRLKQSGCLITGKSHTHPLAYGITGENPDFGDCLQPRDATLLTGGSSAGAAASVQEGSALAAIGTDTGGSVRIPAALCGLVGFRASHSFPSTWPGMWSGGVHLAQSFDTLGLLLRDPRDLAPLTQALFHIAPTAPIKTPRIGCVSLAWLADANPEVLTAYAAFKLHLQQSGAILTDFDPSGWNSSSEIYSGILASQAAAIHRRHADQLLPTLDPAIAQRLRWGATLTDPDLDALHSRHRHFRAAIAALLAQFDFLMLPSAPVNRLLAGADQAPSRIAILRYTTPFSLAGLPVLTLPGELLGAPFGTGVQIAAPQCEDATLIALAGSLS